MTSDSFRVIYVWSGILRSFTNVCKTEKQNKIHNIHCSFANEGNDSQVTGLLIPSTRIP